MSITMICCKNVLEMKKYFKLTNFKVLLLGISILSKHKVKCTHNLTLLHAYLAPVESLFKNHKKYLQRDLCSSIIFFLEKLLHQHIFYCLQIFK